MRLLKVMIISLLLFACDPETRKEVFPSTARKANQISYYKDNRTNLCFAHSTVWNGHGTSSDIFANVPCTPEVESLLIKDE